MFYFKEYIIFRKFPDQKKFAGMIKDAGFRDENFENQFFLIRISHTA